jgi:hypothetical protein
VARNLLIMLVMFPVCVATSCLQTPPRQGARVGTVRGTANRGKAWRPGGGDKRPGTRKHVRLYLARLGMMPARLGTSLLRWGCSRDGGKIFGRVGSVVWLGSRRLLPKGASKGDIHRESCSKLVGSFRRNGNNVYVQGAAERKRATTRDPGRVAGGLWPGLRPGRELLAHPLTDS